MPLARPALALAVCLAQPALAQDLPEGYPPLMGEVSGLVGDKAKRWETYDFSIGSFDASAWVGQDGDDGPVYAKIMAFPPGEPDTLPGRVFAEAEFGPTFRTGEGVNPALSIMQGEEMDGPRLSSEGQRAVFVIDTIGPAREDSYNRRVTGRIEARLCPVDWPGESCREVALTFDTDMQIGSRVIVAE